MTECDESRPLPGDAPRGWALITGASSGLGRALARLCALQGWRLILVARREEALRELARELTRELSGGAPLLLEQSLLVIPLDLTLPDALEDLQEVLRREELAPSCVTLLINNAGVGDHGPFLDLAPHRLEEMIALNVRAITVLAHWLAPEMRPGSTICTVASVAAFTPGPLMAVYYATKAYALSLGEALHHELRPRGVRVVTVCPGPFRSGFHAAAGLRPGPPETPPQAAGPAAAGRPGRLPTAEQVALRVLAAVRRGGAVAPIGAGSWVWAVVGPRLPRAMARRFIAFLQARRRS